MLDPDPKLTTPKRCSSPFRPSSGCTVATKEVRFEAELAIRTFQQFHANVPVYVICDVETKHHLQAVKFDGPVLTFERQLKTPDTVQKHNDYHRADAILWKMDVFHMAVEQSGDAVFFDADILFLNPITGPEDCEVAVSHNLPCLPAEHDGKLHGYFNAGLVWTCNPNFANWWKHQYLHMGGFYEQVGMNFSPRVFRCGYFDFSHNYGFWRGEFENRTLNSIHLHLGTALDKTMPDFMIRCVRKMRRGVWQKLAKEKPEIARLARKILRFPEKLFFIHYGKAGGGYTNSIMQEQIVPDYEIQDSWKENLNRDWTQAELHSIIDDKNGRPKYLHQHHVGIKKEDILKAKQNGWKTFTFLRNPMDVICSLYYWRNRLLMRKQKDVIFNSGDPMLIQAFWEKILQPEYRKLWALPDYIGDVENVMMFSEENLTNFCLENFGYSQMPKEHVNSSGNPGFEQLISDGTITESMLNTLCETPEYKRFSEYAARFAKK